MRDLKQSDRNELKLHDAVSGSEIVFYYRTPTTSEIVAYEGRRVKRVGRKVTDISSQTRFEYALKILTGFRGGDFGYDGKPISSDPESPDYREDWKRLIEETAADLVMMLGLVVFDGAKTSGEREEESPPLPTSSGGSGTGAPRSEEKSA